MNGISAAPGSPTSRTEYLRQASQILRARNPELLWLKIAVLSTFTADFLKPCLVVEGSRLGLGLDVWLGPFGQIEQQALDITSDLFQSQPDLVLLQPRIEDLAPCLAYRFLSLDPTEKAEREQEVVNILTRTLAGLRAGSGALIVLGNFSPVIVPCAGIADGDLEDSQASMIQRLNTRLAELGRVFPDVLVLDTARISAETGLLHWHDNRMNWIARAPLSATALSHLSRAVVRRLRPRFFSPKKCLVLDCDDTLWGGVLGEAGIEGIHLGPDYPGNVFVDFQRRILALRDQGVLLAVASKNNASDVEAVFAKHPSCQLKREHFSAFEVHWGDKATSLQRIARILNIGTDSIVFFDDNPVERAWVRDQLPEVTVPEVPAEPSGYAAVIEQGKWFDPIHLTAEDRKRSELYRQEILRRELQSDVGSAAEFLCGLDMRLTYGLVDSSTLPRITQLLARTNQFNLTTRRHSEAAILAMLDQGGACLWIRIRDRFGDSGIVGVALAVPEVTPSTWRIDTFLMSCRVIGRRVETALLALLEREIWDRGGRHLRGEYFPTAKNQPAAAFFKDHDFTPGDSEGTQWSLTLIQPRTIPEIFQID